MPSRRSFLSGLLATPIALAFARAIPEGGFRWRTPVGTLRVGGSLKNLIEYGQNFAVQEYTNVFDRALAQYDRHYRSHRLRSR